jgi:hypothetical protein
MHVLNDGLDWPNQTVEQSQEIGCDLGVLALETAVLAATHDQRIV